MSRYLFAILALLWVSGCASAKTERRMDELEKQLSSIQRDQALSRDRLDEINRLGNSLFLLQDRFEVMSLEIERLEDDIADLAYGEPFAAAPIATPAEPPRTETARTASAPARNEEVRAPAKREDAVATYRKAFDLLMQADYDQAAPLFHDIVRDFPEHDLADNSLYWLAEIDYAKEKYRDAVRGFQRVLDEYPKGNKVPDALLKMAYSLLELGEHSTALQHLEQILSDYGWSDPAKHARERLDMLGERHGR